jgi:hypothetical protein
MEKLLFATKTLNQEEGTSLEYYLLTEPVQELAADSYGIEVVLRDHDQEDRSQCRHITPVGSRILSMLTTVADGAVTPCQLRDVVCDLLA